MRFVNVLNLRERSNVRERSPKFANVHPSSWTFAQVRERSLKFVNVHPSSRTYFLKMFMIKKWTNEQTNTYRSFDSRPLQWPYREYSLPYSDRTLSGRSFSTTVYELTSVTGHRSWSTVHLLAFMCSAFTFRCFFKSFLNNSYSKIFTKNNFF